ncbi:MAG: hypothetical protein KDJ18_09980 [Hyphomicrobiaceae bacterium]|nr:hypothetical protein [Hyphomicrobiaceae bacterium]
MSRPMVNHVEQRERRLDQLLERLGVNLSRFRRDASGATYERASWNCVRCRHPDACRDLIEGRVLMPKVAPGLCPNCEIIHAYMSVT